VKTLLEIQDRLQAGEFEFTRHAFKRVVERNISDREMIEAGVNIIIIEDYPDDKYSHSCLLLGFTIISRALHIQVSMLDSDLLKIITIYELAATEWIDYRTRRE